MKTANLTKRGFERLLKKAAQPKKLPDSKEIRTSVESPSDDCSGKCKNQGKTVDAKD